MISKKFSSKKTGFTLIETLVAITILLVAIAGPLAIIAKNISYSAYARDQVTASYLAQEAIEVLRRIRDNDALANPGSTPWAPPSFAPCINNDGANPLVSCFVDAKTDTVVPVTTSPCTLATCPITFDSSSVSGLYQNSVPPASGPTITNTKFTRTVTITRAPSPSNDRELHVDVKLAWNSQGVSKTYDLLGVLMRD